MGLNPEDYGFYLDLRKYGSTRHAGFGLGFERCVMYLTGMSNIRDVIPFPRTVNNCELQDVWGVGTLSYHAFFTNFRKGERV